MRVISAVYANGVFRPDQPVDLPAGAQVQVTLPDSTESRADRLRKRFPNSIGTLSPDEADRIQVAIEEQFERVNPDDWK